MAPPPSTSVSREMIVVVAVVAAVSGCVAVGDGVYRRCLAFFVCSSSTRTCCPESNDAKAAAASPRQQKRFRGFMFLLLTSERVPAHFCDHQQYLQSTDRKPVGRGFENTQKVKATCVKLVCFFLRVFYDQVAGDG